VSRTALPRQADGFPAWYAETVRRADLAEHGPVRGTMIIRPYGTAIWELVQRALDDRIKATGHENVVFPMLMPAALLEREAEMVDGFAPEVAVVTRAGGAELAEPLVLRPTSEALVWSTYAGWLQSYRDLPLLYNQWANVVRWEMRPRLFLRSTEFLWQEGHTAHETHAAAQAEARLILDEVYAATLRDVLAIPVLRGRKSPSERFPAALDTLTCEVMLRDRKALQAATSHDLGQSFARTYGVTFADRNGRPAYPYATSWGASTRLIGGLVMAHGDDRGLRLPPAVAPHQVVIVPIGDTGSGAAALAAELRDHGVRVRVDDRERREGKKFHEWDRKGVPLRVDLGPRELAAGVAVVTRRDTGEQWPEALDGLAARTPARLAEIQRSLYAEALDFYHAHIATTDDRDWAYDELARGEGWVIGGWCGRETCEQDVKQATGATIRCLPHEFDPEPSCLVCDQPSVGNAVWALAY
jgi:prolyl-tRNA synthetase